MTDTLANQIMIIHAGVLFTTQEVRKDAGDRTKVPSFSNNSVLVFFMHPCAITPICATPPIPVWKSNLII